MKNFPIRKSVTFIILSAGAVMSASAQEPTDSVKVHELEAVTVEAAAQTTSASKSTYLPSKKQKNASTNAIMLLSRMQIPEINVDMASGSVTDLTGKDVAIFIDGKMAQNQDLQGMRMSDVLRVEYLVNPSDPRFQQKPVVVNFIMKQYIYGGYTKLYETVNYLPWEKDNTNSLFLYSRMVVKKTTWNLWGNFSNSYDAHKGQESWESFTFNNRNVEREQTVDRYRQRYIRSSGGIENIYADNDRGIWISQEMSLHYNRNSERYQEGKILFNTDEFLSGSYRRSTPSRSITPVYNGSFNFNLGKGWSTYTRLHLEYNHEDSNNDYSVTGAEPIVNDLRSDNYNMQVIQNVAKTISDRHLVMLQASGTFNWNSLDYTGDNPLSLRMNNQNMEVSAWYQLQLPKLYLTVSPGMEIFWRKSGDEFRRSVAPNVSAFMRYSPDSKNSIQLNMGYYSSFPADVSLSSHLSRDNEILFSVGNPALKNLPSFYSNLQYVWFPSNRFTGAAYVNYNVDFDKVTAIYTPMTEGFALLQSRVNNGNYHTLNVGLNLTCKLLDGNLTIQASPALTHKRCTGIYDSNYTYFDYNASANYYIGAFNIGVLYRSHQHSMADNGARIRISDRYEISGGWGNKNWSLNLVFANPFRRGWKEQRRIFHSSLYSYTTQNFSRYHHSMIAFQVCYTFGYGKQVSHGNERRPSL